MADLGFGNHAGSLDLDWTFAHNAHHYIIKTLQVFVLPQGAALSPRLLGATGWPHGSNVVLRFTKALDDAATNISHYTLSGGITVLGAVLEPINKLNVTLIPTPLRRDTNYTLTVQGVRDRVGNLISPGNLSTFAPVDSPAFARLPEAAAYQLVHYLALPTVTPHYHSNGLTYNLGHWHAHHDRQY